MTILIQILLLILAYILGSIPFALIIGKLVKKIDIREYGSKNMGATNTFRVLGFGWGFLVFILDFLKAGLLVFIMKHNFFHLDYTNSFQIPILIYGIAALLGHLFPIFAHFKGGKGVSCTAGIFCAYNPLIFLFAITGFIIVAIITKYVSLSSCTAGVIIMISSLIFELKGGNPDWVNLVLIYIAIPILILKHIPNFKRIINHTESKLNFKHIKDKSQPAFVKENDEAVENSETK